MATKTISITDDAYNRLASRKREKESFSSVINRLTSKKSLLNYARILSKGEVLELESNIKKSRSLSKKRTQREI